MNFVLIPFFLAANVSTNQADIWSYGPEYTFDATIAYVISAELTEEPFHVWGITTTVKCRPKMMDSLLCRMEDALLVSHNEPTEAFKIDDLFEVKFNERGVESLAFAEPLEISKLNIIRSIATQFSIGADLKENANNLPAFVAKEHFVFGECATLFTVLHYDKSEDQSKKDVSGKEWNYSLKVLSLPERQPGSNIVIEKKTDDKRCTKSDEVLSNLNRLNIKIGKSTSKIQITDTEMFRSQTEIHVKMSKRSGPKDSILRNLISMELKSIEPAKEELPLVPFEDTASIMFGDLTDHNFIF